MLKILEKRLQKECYHWTITGVAGFIGSHLLEVLLKFNQKVTGLDNFATGRPLNLEDVKSKVTPEQWANFELINGDITNIEDCNVAVKNSDFILHHAALGSVPASIDDPVLANHVNVTGFVNMLEAGRKVNIKRFVFATSSATYGDTEFTPKFEHHDPSPMSPYALTKHINEQYADMFSQCYGLDYVGLRYFNIFGPRQDPNGAYAAVIPRWTASLINAEPVYIFGDGEAVRDFCFVEDVVQANILAALSDQKDALNHIYNIAGGQSITLNGLFDALHGILRDDFEHLNEISPIYEGPRAGDIKISEADISKAKNLLRFDPGHDVANGLRLSMDWYKKFPG